MELNVLTEAMGIGRSMGAPIDRTEPGAAVVIPQNFKVEALDQYIEKHLPAPRRTRARVVLNTAESFVAYVKEFKRPCSKLFMTVPTAPGSAPSFVAVIDYHAHKAEADEPVPAWCEHRAQYNCTATVEWVRFMKADRQVMTQEQFALFLEENQGLLVEPAGAALLELVSNLQAHNDITCNQMVRLANGRCKVLYSEEVTLKNASSSVEGELEFPTSLVAGIAPFDGSAKYKVNCRMKYRLQNRRLEFWFEVIDPHLVIRDAVEDVVGLIEDKLDMEPLEGLAP